MNCPLETPESAELLLDYCSRKLSAETAGLFERHMEMCPACRRFAEEQRAVWSALDTWEVQPVSADFDRNLYQRIEKSRSWRDSLSRWLRPVMAYHGVPAAVAACLVLAAGIMIQQSNTPVPPTTPDVANAVDVQPEQVESALDAMDVLSEFNRKARTEAQPEHKL